MKFHLGILEFLEKILDEILLKLPNPVKMCEKIINFSQIPLINP